MKKVLHMTFVNDEGNNKTLQLPDPRPELTGDEVQAAMQKVLDNGLFPGFVSLKSAKVVQTTTQQLDIEVID